MNCSQRVLERLAALDVEVVRRLVEDQHVRARVHEDRERQPLALAAGEADDRLLGVLAGEQEAAEQRARLVRRQPRRALRRLEHGAVVGQRLGVLGEVADLDVVAGAQLAGRRAGGCRRASRSASSCRSRWRRRARRARRAPATARRRRAAPCRGPRSRPSSSSKITRPLRSGALNWNDSEAVSRGSRSIRSILSSRLTRDCACLGLRRLRAEALDEALQALDLRLLLVDRAAERDLARRLLAAPRVPRARRRSASARPPAPAPRCRPPPGTSGRGRRARPRRPSRRGSCSSHSSDADVEVVRRLVEQQQVGVAGERARERAARQLPAGEGATARGRGRRREKPRPCSIACARSRQR